ncbi:2Fe-2S iron-sulfur cluster-binding protein [Mesorhizobium sp. CAU 1741]|uniref:2Fe-2S iron-sulfur cluster-binding protein n=1 Tax=Mesorhizobium sp. CAU 1741 TaxID=3140366 RepID=UPI00325B498A
MSGRRIGNNAQAALRFTFDGKPHQGQAGDTIASALLGSGVRIVGRSFKYHRPRGIFGSWSEEPNAIVDVTLAGVTTPNLRATTELLQDGMDIRSVNARPTAEGDRLGLLDRLSPFLPAGFYYKTFLWPDWHVFEPRIRGMAGLGRLDPGNEPPAEAAIVNAVCDVLVVGAGPAGLEAARDAAIVGDRVILVDDQFAPGGSMLHREPEGAAWAAKLVAEFEQAGGRLLLRTTAFGIYDHNLVCCWERRIGASDRQWRIRPRRIVLATGAIERPLVLPDNDRPGVMAAEAALVYLRRHGVMVGQRVVLATNNDRALAVADALRQAGAQVTVADLRDGATIDAIHGANGVEAVTVSGKRVEADCVLLSGGHTPTIHLFCQAKGKLRYSEDIAAFVPGDPVEGVSVIGAAAGDLGDYSVTPAWPKPGSKSRQWVDFQNDVTLKDVELAARENFRSVEHLKRYTTLGMATDQGKTSNMNGLAAMAAITGRTIQKTGTTTYRPPFTPVPFTVVAGRRRGELFNPTRRLALEAEHRAAGAVFREYGGWLRAAWYGQGTATDEVTREARQARETVAIFDGSPLGKIEVFGPQAGALVDYNSYNTLSTLKPGRIRYGFMLTETGVIYDDGVVSKLADDHYVVSCSSGHVAGVVARLEEWRQDRFDPRQVFVHNLTPHWSTLTACGPRAKALVDALSLGVDLDDAALPHMATADGSFEGAPARVARVSFTGDRSYEISVPGSKAASLWQAMNEAGRTLDAVLMGSEALLLLRAEKGYIIAGKDTDGTSMPQDLGLTGPRDKRAGEYVGKRSLFTENAMRDDRQQLVGLTVSDGGAALTTGSHAVAQSGGSRRSIGFVTSSYDSPTLGRPIALGLIQNGLARMGEEIEFVHLGTPRRATVSAPCAFDAEGSRLNA